MDLSQRAANLVARLSSADGDVGFMTCAIYDTAWVSMICKPSESGTHWLFPQCFRYILENQQQDGSWKSYASEIDGILNTAASLLALKLHEEKPLQLADSSSRDLGKRINAATASLEKQLKTWDVDATVHVGFEYLVPTLLGLLRDKGLDFDYPGRTALMALNTAKMSKFKPEYLYSKQKLTALHSLEAFVGQIDFNKVRHHKEFGAFMASPSSTAAYLMHASSWDDEAEAYLHTVLELGAGQSSGGVPSAFPSTYFEVTWVLTTLLKNNYSVTEIGKDLSEHLANLLKTALAQQDGVTGFAPSIQPDADDTSKALSSLSAMGEPISPIGLLDHFEGDDHFRTYTGERNPSFSANCNVLVSLLSLPNPSLFGKQIEKATSFLCKAWWESDGWIQDKWVSVSDESGEAPINVSFRTCLSTIRLCLWQKLLLQPLSPGTPVSCHPCRMSLYATAL
jgi:hypothetical protein